MSDQPPPTSTSAGAVEPVAAPPNPPAAAQHRIPCPNCYKLYISEAAVCQHLALPGTECAKWAAALLDNVESQGDDGMYLISSILFQCLLIGDCECRG